MDFVQHNITPDKKRKYFFAWHLVNGLPFCFKYIEDDGIIVGGRPELAQEPMEITEEEFNTDGNLNDLAKQHPLHTKEGDISAIQCLDNEPDLT